jgi:hypothetical protein
MFLFHRLEETQGILFHGEERSSEQDFSKLRAAALDRSTKKQNNRVGLEEDIARNENESGADHPTPLREGLDTDTNTAYPLAFFQFPFVYLPSATYSPELKSFNSHL